VKLLLVNSAWPQSWGGGEKWTVEAADWFCAHGHEAVVVGRPDSRVTTAARERQLIAEETPFGGDFDPWAIRRAGALLKKHKPDAVLVNFNKEAWQFGFAGRLQKIPVLARHGLAIMSNRPHHRWLRRHLISRLVVNATSIRERYAQLGLDARGIEVIFNGAAARQQKSGELRGRLKIAAETKLVLAAGRIESQKRFDLLIDIASRLMAENIPAVFAIAGEGPLREDLEARVRSLDLCKQVMFAGFIGDLAEVIGDADLFLLTSEDEGTPNVLLEAMMAKVACLSFGVGSVPEILSDEHSVSVFPFGDTAAMADRAAMLLLNDVRRRTLAEVQHRHVLGHYSLDASMRRFEEILNQMRRRT
jgi:glycosyltransferase involved in cell wall biosynthesis